MQFWVFSADGGRMNDEHRSRRTQILRLMSDVNDRPARAQLTNLFVLDGIRAMHAKARIEQQMRETAHATTTRADEIHRRTGTGAGQQRAHLLWSEVVHVDNFKFEIPNFRSATTAISRASLSFESLAGLAV